MIKVKIKHPGAHMMAGKELRELEVGEVLELQGDELPNFLIGKAEILGDNEGKSLATNDELLNSAIEENAQLTSNLESARGAIDALSKDNKGLTELLDGVRAELKAAIDNSDSLKAENEKLTAEIAELKKPKAGK